MTNKMFVSGLIEELSSHWGREPRLFRNALRETIYTEESLLQMWQHTALKTRERLDRRLDKFKSSGKVGKRNRPDVRLFLNSQLIETVDDATAFFPNANDCLETVLSRIESFHPGKGFCGIIDNCESVNPRLRRELIPSFHDLFERIGYPARDNHFCLYIGNYRATPFKIHRDDAHVLMSVGFGSKKMAFWPQNAIDENMLLSETISLTQELLSSATVIEVGPKDLLYWPPDYWHISVNEDAGFKSSISMGIYHQGGSADFFDTRSLTSSTVVNKLGGYDQLNVPGVQRFENEIEDALPEFVWDDIQRQWDTLREALDSYADTKIGVISKLLHTFTGAGFESLEEDERLPVGELYSGLYFRAVEPRSLEYYVCDRNILVGANGNIFTYPDSSASPRSIIDSLMDGKRIKLCSENTQEKEILLDLYSVRALQVEPGE